MSTVIMKTAEPPVNSGSSLVKTEYTVSRYILEQLKAWEVKRIYGVIGDTNLGLLDEL